jgi:hypothetical protein
MTTVRPATLSIGRRRGHELEVEREPPDHMISLVIAFESCSSEGTTR